MKRDLITQVISREKCAVYVAHIISGEFAGGKEFKPRKILRILLRTYKINCSYENLMRILDKLVKSKRLVLVSRQKYTIKPAA